MGFIDIHFHGAFGVDLTTASLKDLDHLAHQLWQKGINGFCPTTLSLPETPLLETVKRLGAWIRSIEDDHKIREAAIPLGIHLEGPFIHPRASGAHPPSALRPLQLQELEQLWSVSQETLKLVTFAPELLTATQLKELVKWTKARKITLSIGHTLATFSQAQDALKAGAKGATHGWNAMKFHQRDPGTLGAIVGQKDKYLELIIDQAHVHPEILHWMTSLHGFNQTCFVSDCVPEGHFGPLTVPPSQKGDRAHYLPNRSLAGGSLLLTDSYADWLKWESKAHSVPLEKLWKQSLPSVTSAPLRYLGISSSLFQKCLGKHARLHAQFSTNSVRFSRNSR